eukprot:5289094-Prymnesium_polylepis.1
MRRTCAPVSRTSRLFDALHSARLLIAAAAFAARSMPPLAPPAACPSLPLDVSPSSDTSIGIAPALAIISRA